MERFKIIISIVLAINFLLIIGLGIGQKNLNQKITALKTLQESKIVTNLNLPSPTPSLSLEPSPSLNPTLQSSPSLIPYVNPAPAPSIPFQPQIVYLGSASTTQTDWTVTNVEVRLNSNDYPADVIAYFEAGLSIVNGEAWARLKNKTTGAIMSITEIYNNTNSIVWKTSPSFKLHSGNNVYVVEIKSSSSELANLSGARITISK
ncbi:MAG: hypothetical protein V1810_04715 [Candidatus Beckwithbacteria bacterium]